MMLEPLLLQLVIVIVTIVIRSKRMIENVFIIIYVYRYRGPNRIVTANTGVVVVGEDGNVLVVKLSVSHKYVRSSPRFGNGRGHGWVYTNAWCWSVRCAAIVPRSSAGQGMRIMARLDKSSLGRRSTFTMHW